MVPFLLYTVTSAFCVTSELLLAAARAASDVHLANVVEVEVGDRSVDLELRVLLDAVGDLEVDALDDNLGALARGDDDERSARRVVARPRARGSRGPRRQARERATSDLERWVKPNREEVVVARSEAARDAVTGTAARTLASIIVLAGDIVKMRSRTSGLPGRSARVLRIRSRRGSRRSRKAVKR